MIPDAVKLKLAPLLLRLGLGIIFIYHGWGKVQAEFGTAWYPDLPVYQQAAVAWGEFLGGIALIIGFLPRLAAAGIAVIMAGAIATVHGKHGFGLHNPADPKAVGFEYNFALIIMCLAVIVLGGGPLSLGHRLFRRKKQA